MKYLLIFLLLIPSLASAKTVEIYLEQSDIYGKVLDKTSFKMKWVKNCNDALDTWIMLNNKKFHNPKKVRTEDKQFETLYKVVYSYGGTNWFKYNLRCY